MRSRAGLTFVELIVALVLLSVGLTALASTAARTARQINQSRVRSEAAAVLSTRAELVHASGCSASRNGSASTGRVSETWSTSTGGGIVSAAITVSYPAHESWRLVEARTAGLCN